MAISVEHRKFFPTLPLKEFPLKLGMGAYDQKKKNDGATRPRKTFDDTFNRLVTIHEREYVTDGQTDGRTDGRIPANSRNRAYA